MIWVLLNHWKIFLIIGGGAVLALFIGLYFLETHLRHRALLKSQKFCRKCGGTGKLEDRSSCPLCKGTGIPPVCPVCGGDGKIDAEKRCSYCMGTGTEIM
ncbi:MAG: hypothetical protein ACYS47_13505 [Planctomycetota bacterium]|jgi:DnaJ-class molecular chaperone